MKNFQPPDLFNSLNTVWEGVCFDKLAVNGAWQITSPSASSYCGPYHRSMGTRNGAPNRFYGRSYLLTGCIAKSLNGGMYGQEFRGVCWIPPLHHGFCLLRLLLRESSAGRNESAGASSARSK